MRYAFHLLLAAAAFATSDSVIQAQAFEASRPFKTLDQLDQKTMRDYIDVAQRYAEEVAGGRDEVYYQELGDALLEISGKSRNAAPSDPQDVQSLRPEPDAATHPDVPRKLGTIAYSTVSPDVPASVHELVAPPDLRKDKVWQRNFQRLVALPADVVLHSYGGGETATLVNSRDYLPCVAVGNERGSYGGSGVLIGSNVVLTAAHVIEGGYHDRIFIGHNVEDLDEGRVVQVKQGGAVPHPEYDLDVILVRCSGMERGYQQVQHDLGVLILKEHVQDVPPVSLASEQVCLRHRTDHGVLRGVGFGFAINPAEGLVSPGGRQTTVLLPIGNSEEHQYLCDAEREVIAGDARNDTCAGDSGGPLLIEQDGSGTSRFLVAALVSRGLPCSGACSGGGGINTLVYPYLDWVREVADQHGGRIDLR